MRVELDIFSGRPNPAWDLTAEESSECLKRLRDLPQIDSGDVQQGLGYRGIIVTSGDSQGVGFDRLVVSQGRVLVKQADDTRSFLDRERAFEYWLFRTGKGRVDKALFDQIALELGLK